MPTAFPRAVVYDPAADCHLTVIVRRDKGYFAYWCADHDSLDAPLDGANKYALDLLEQFKAWLRENLTIQVMSWLEVTDDGC